MSQPLVPTPQTTGRSFPVIGQWLLAGAGGLILAIGLGTVVDVAVLSIGPPRGTISRLLSRLRRHARRLRIPLSAGDTPLELLAALSNRLSAIAEAHGFTGVEFIEPGIDEIGSLVELYALAWYSPAESMTRAERRRAIWLWWRLRWRLWLARLWRRSGRPAEQPVAPPTDVDVPKVRVRAARP